MKRFLIGFLLLGFLYLYLVRVGNWHPAGVLQMHDNLKLILNIMTIKPIFSIFHLTKDDPRIIYPIILTTAFWGTVGGTMTVVLSKVIKYFNKSM